MISSLFKFWPPYRGILGFVNASPHMLLQSIFILTFGATDLTKAVALCMHGILVPIQILSTFESFATYITDMLLSTK